MLRNNLYKNVTEILDLDLDSNLVFNNIIEEYTPIIKDKVSLNNNLYELPFSPPPPKQPSPSHQPSPPKFKKKVDNFFKTSNPKIWGEKIWYSLHNGAAYYPKDPSPITIHKMKGFVKGIPFILPCDECRIHAINYIEERDYELDKICENRKNLFKFFVDMHNFVNLRTNKKKFTKKDVKKIYNIEI